MGLIDSHSSNFIFMSSLVHSDACDAGTFRSQQKRSSHTILPDSKPPKLFKAREQVSLLVEC